MANTERQMTVGRTVGKWHTQVWITREDIEARQAVKARGFHWTGENWQLMTPDKEQASNVVRELIALGFIMVDYQDTELQASRCRALGFNVDELPIHYRATVHGESTWQPLNEKMRAVLNQRLEAK